MTIPSWPTAIPFDPLLGSLQISRTAEAPLSTEMNAGTTRRRRKFTVRMGEVAMSIIMTHDESEAFRVFHEETLSDGASRFAMPIWFAGAFRIQTSLFAEPPSYEPFGEDHVKVSFGLLVENLGTGALYVPEPPDYTPSLDFSNPLNSGYVALI